MREFKVGDRVRFKKDIDVGYANEYYWGMDNTFYVSDRGYGYLVVNSKLAGKGTTGIYTSALKLFELVRPTTLKKGV